MLRHTVHWKFYSHSPPTHVITVLVVVTHRTASCGIVIGYFRVGARNKFGHDVLGIVCRTIGRRNAFQEQEEPIPLR